MADEKRFDTPLTEYNDKPICDLLTYFSENTYHPSNKIEEQPRDYVSDVIKLMERDYIVMQVPNEEGRMCFQYPYIIPIMKSHRNNTTIYENEDENKSSYMDLPKISQLFDDAKLARCRQRFPCPVILFRGQNICRSATIASLPEICYRNGLNDISSFEALASIKEFLWPSEEMFPDAQEIREAAPVTSVPQPEEMDYRAKTFCDKVRNEDIRLLKSFNVSSIVDIMVEKRKVKHGLYVSASEKVEPERYVDFKLINLPYPGCEFFKDYANAMFTAEGLKYHWDHPANDAEISVPDDNLAKTLSINWQEYKQWDLVLITQNYMKYILKRLQEDNSGLLIHCISGWDRTPLFISLLRLSLWADGLVHESLDEYEILYLTLVYDWYLFGHHLANRLYKKEEIMAFCFDFLKYITGEEFSVKTSKKKFSEEKTSDDSRSPTKSYHSARSDPGSEESIGSKSLASLLAVAMSEEDIDPLSLMNVDAEGSTSSKHMEIADPSSDDSMDTCEGLGKAREFSTLKPHLKRTAPIQIGGPTMRRRSDSTGSNTSNISANWQLISDCGSVEKDFGFLKPLRVQRLERVRTIFNASYQKTVKSDSYGPPSKWVIEEIVSGLAQWLETNNPGASNKQNGGGAKNGKA